MESRFRARFYSTTCRSSGAGMLAEMVAEGQGRKNAKEEVDVEHVDESGAGDACHTAELKAEVMSNETEQFFHCGDDNAVEGACAIGRDTQGGGAEITAKGGNACSANDFAVPLRP